MEQYHKQLELSCEEIFSNIINYSGAEYALFQCDVEADKINIVFTDNGKCLIHWKIKQKRSSRILMKAEWGSVL